ncbi:MAG: hypothetical protein JXR70_02965 [Spirochaetales bacterium]|nr:hypothetical protein [Spirochaetales bacterium]
MRFLTQRTLLTTIIGVLSLLILIPLSAQQEYDHNLDWKKLSQGHIFIKAIRDAESKIPGVKAWFIVKTPLDFIWETMINSEKERDIYTTDYKLNIIQKTDNYEDVEYEVVIFFNKFKYVLHRIFDKANYRISWDKTKGDFKSMNGYWEIQKTPESGSYLIIYESYVNSGFFIPEFIVQLVQQDETRKTMIKLRDWLEKNKS